MKLPKITNKQKEILYHLYRFRFLTRIQIQQLLSQNSHQNTNAWLKDLSEKQYINRIYKKQLGINQPAIYYIGSLGIKFLRSREGTEKEYIRRLYKESQRSEAFIKQSILIANQFLLLRKKYTETLKFYTATDFPSNGIIRQIGPSFAFIIQEIKNQEYFICEILKEKTPRFAIRARIQQIIEFFKLNTGQSIKFIFYTPNTRLEKYIANYANKLLDEENISHIQFLTIALHENNNH